MVLFNQSKLYAPEMEGGVDGGAEGEAPRIPLNELPVDGPGSGRSKLRTQLEKSVTSERTGREKREAGEAKEVKKPARARGPNHVEEAEETVGDEAAVTGGAAEGETEETGEAAEGEAAVAEGEAAPDRFSKEAKAEWAKTPAVVQQAVIKAEKDMIAGVTALKQRYASIDEVLTPRMDVIRKHGHTPAQAVNQLFAWFEALAANPTQAFPALAQSFKFDLNSMLALQGKQPQKAQPGAEGAQEGQQQEQVEITPAVQKLIDGVRAEFSSQLGGLTQSFQQQNMTKTKEILGNWSKDKPYFEDVRQYMAQLIATGVVPAREDGSSDLDTAYETAIWAIPTIRAKIQADQTAAIAKAAADKKAKEQKLQQEQANKARRTSGASLAGGAPGNPVQPAKKGKGKSVRESIMEAREEVTGT